MTRITGLATGLDVDTIVKQTMQAYQSKIDTQKQKKDVVEIKQQLYRDIIKEAQELYNKHFDVLKEGSLIKSSTWQSVTFKSSNPNVTVTGSSSSKVGDYTIEAGSVIAKAATIAKSEVDLGNKIVINGYEFKIEEGTPKEKAEKLNKALSDKGLNITVRYTDFVVEGEKESKKQFIFESKNLGANSSFIIGGEKANITLSNGKDATATVITGLTVEQLQANKDESSKKVSFKVDDTEFTIDISSANSNKDIEDLLNKAMQDNGYTVKVDDPPSVNITLTTTKLGEDKTEHAISINGTTIETNSTNGSDATSAQVDISSSITSSNKIIINGVYIDLSKKESLSEIDYINNILKENKVSIKAEKSDSGIALKSTIVGSKSKVEFSTIDGTEDNIARGENANIIVNNGTGKYTYTGNTNNFTVDGITFNFTGNIPNKDIEISSSKDSTKIIENINKYIEDYNSLIVKINTLTLEKRDKNYNPLTDAQKEEMSDKEIELWEAKVKQGQLRRDSDLMRVSNALTQGMKNLVSGSGLTLKDIGIESVQDYGGTKDGTFKIDPAKLKEAIENNTESVAKLFTQNTSDTTSNAYNEKGIMVRLKEILYDEAVSSKSILSKKVGFEGTVTVVDNVLTKQMESYQKKIDEMKNLYSDKEQALYSKYAKLETIMNNYNSQMTYLSQSLGLG